MAIIFISSVPFGGGDQLAKSLAGKLGYAYLSREDMVARASEFGIPVGKLEVALVKRPSVQERMARLKERYLAVATATLCEKAAEGGLVYYGRAGHHLLSGVSHVVRIRVIPEHDERVERAMHQLRMPREKVEQYLADVDADVRAWVRFVHGADMDDPTRYDFVVNLEKVGAENVASALCGIIELPDFRPTPASLRATQERLLRARARIRLALDERTADADFTVHSSEGVLTISYMPRQARVAGRIPEVLDDLPGCREILGQVKQAYSLACAAGTVERVLHRLFHSAFRVGKQVRSETRLGSGSRSLCGAALDLMNDVVGGLRGKRLVIVGVNSVTEVVADRTRGLAEQVFVNRTHCKAAALAARHGGSAVRFEEIEAVLRDADAVFTCTGAERPILGAAGLRAILDARGGDRPLVICDLAVPRDVEPTGDDRRVVLLDQDAVQARVLREERHRREHIDEAEEIVAEHAAAFWLRLSQGRLPDQAPAFLDAARHALQRELGRCSATRTPAEMILLEEFGARLLESVGSLGIAHLRAQRAVDADRSRRVGTVVGSRR